MGHPPDTVARRFPLIARPRPACLPLAQRIHALSELADTAAKSGDAGIASTVYNQAALLASDTGATNDARTLCHRHAAAYLHAAPLPGKAAIRALEPVINLARLHIRAGRADNALQHLHTLFDAATTARPARIENIVVPAALTTDDDARQEVRTWLWSVLIADGTRALTTAGRFSEALTHVQAHRGVGRRMLDGRQVAVLAALTTGHPDRAEALLQETTPSAPWEQAVTACLTALCRPTAQPPAGRHAHQLADIYTRLAPEPGRAVFDARLGLTVLDLIGRATPPAAYRVVNELHRRTAGLNDGYAARENLTHPLFTAFATSEQKKHCQDLVNRCALGSGHLPDDLRDRLTRALHTSDRTIRRSLTRTEHSPTTRKAPA
ncbi:hypothetical protein [Streptomyces sp. NPDC005017]|uniref:hypothetical protein n=1 Tax=Streptomyces sp. NPDC005017 TaxID=3364706 RepID=UPI0036B88E86